MARSKSSQQWLDEHFDDPYVQKAQQEGYRSRACYKLLELHERNRIFRPGMNVVDLGAAPGSWSQVASELVGPSGQVLACDLLPMDGLAGVTFIQGDFTDDDVYQALLSNLNGQGVDVVISDMAPNMSGIAAIDQPSALYLVELALALAQEVLATRGVFVAKVFQGEGFDAYVKSVRTSFANVLIRKPKSSRPRSREVYLVAQGFLGVTQ